MNKRLYIIFTLIFLELIALLVFFSAEYNKGYKTSSYITDKVRENCIKLVSDLCLNVEYTPQNVTEHADSIVIGTVISLDSTDPSEGLFGTTTGRILVQQSLKGNLEEGQVIKYLKHGGIMKLSEWEENQPLAARQKREYLRNKNGVDIDLENAYLDVALNDDIPIEEGYTYLINLRKYDDRYEIIGLDQGLRKVNVNYSSRVTTNQLDTNTLKIKNNKTNEFESLQEYIDTYINKGE